MMTTPLKAGRREWLGLAVLALPCMVYSMDLTVLNLAVPAITAELSPSAGQLLWIVDIYGFMVAGALITMGTLGDRIGRRRLLMIGAVAFGLVSILAAFSNSAGMLIVTRAMLGLAGATLAPSTLSLIRNMFPDPQERTLAIGIWIASFSAGGAIGPLVGGFLLEHFWWGSVFLVAVPVMAMLLVLGPILLPEFRDPRAGRLDLRSAVLSLLTVLPVIYGIKRLAEYGLGWLPFAAIAVGIACGIVFARRQLGLADPLVDLSLFRRGSFSAAIAINGLGVLFMFGSFLFIAQYLQLVVGLSPLIAGLWTLPSALAFIAGSMIVPLLARRVSVRRLMIGGLLVAALGFALLSRLTVAGELWLLAFASVIMSFGFTPVVALTTDIIVGSAPPERAGSAAAMSETSLEFGGATGIALLGSLVTVVYRSEVAPALPPGLPEPLAEAARSTVGGAVAAAARMGEPVATPLLSLSRAAFTEGMQDAALISLSGLLLTALIALLFLRDPPPDAASAH